MTKKKKQTEKITYSQSNQQKLGLTFLSILTIIFIYHIESYKFIQDDSFITFRYIKNFITGNGLVFNIGERVEGYTTFLWTIMLALPAKLGFDLIPSSQYLGVLFGIFTLFATYQLSRKISAQIRPFVFNLIAVLLFTASSAAAYWFISGMETGFFTFLTILSILLFLQEHNKIKKFYYAPVLFFLLSLTRPEGMFLFGLSIIFLLYELIRKEKQERASFTKLILIWLIIYTIPTGIFMSWRLSYYGYLFPNTYYAKAGISTEYFKAGLDYFLKFAENYLVWGALLILPIYLLIKKKWNNEILYCTFITFAYSAYIIIVGGDVLAAFRFFIPILPIIYILVQESFYEIYKNLEAKFSQAKYIVYALIILLTYYTYITPKDYVRRYQMLEIGLVEKMKAYGLWIKSKSNPNTVIAASTIGAISYYAEVTLIDMLGLTDETIAHKPEKIFGLTSGWKERNYNATYVLSRKPDWICFSTGYKPSAFAERALFLKKEFRQLYYPYYFHLNGNVNNVGIIYKRATEPLPSSYIFPDNDFDTDFINNYYEGVNRIERWPNDALEYFQKSLRQAPKDFPLLYEAIARAYMRLEKYNEAIQYYEKAISIDPRMVESRYFLGYVALQKKDLETAKKHFEALTYYDPDYSAGWTLLGHTYTGLNELEKARQAYNTALRLTPNNKDAAMGLQNLSRR